MLQYKKLQDAQTEYFHGIATADYLLKNYSELASKYSGHWRIDDFNFRYRICCLSSYLNNSKLFGRQHWKNNWSIAKRAITGK
jgi:hypothetical protein